MNAPSSLRQLHLVDQALADPHFDLLFRAFDKRWHYEGIVPINVGGFNPWIGAGLMGEHSLLSKWAHKSRQPIRSTQTTDQLVNEVLWLTHDYLHAWSYRAINQLRPNLGLGTRRISERNFEDLAFAHLLTEAVAVTGLDYWYLATFGRGSKCPPSVRGKFLAVTYHERDLSEYRRYCPDFRVQEPAFFSRIFRSYCTGRYEGFAIGDLRRSPRLRNWLAHELQYGIKQRRYTRLWLSYLAGKPGLAGRRPDRPIAFNQNWQIQLVTELGQLLWEKVKNGTPHFIPWIAPPEETWNTRNRPPTDFRFVNIRRLAERSNDNPASKAEFPYLFYQYLSTFDLARFDRELLKLVPHLLEKADIKLMESVLRHQPRLAAIHTEPSDMLLMN